MGWNTWNKPYFLLIGLVFMETAIPAGGLGAAIFPRGTGYTKAFTQNFQLAPGAEWLSGVSGAGSFSWQPDGYLETILVNNPGGQRDEFHRTLDVPALTRLHDFSFTGTFRIAGNTLGPGGQNTVCWGLGEGGTPTGGIRPGVSVAVEYTSAGGRLSIRSWTGGGAPVQTGDPVALQTGADYSVRVSHFVNSREEWICQAEVYSPDGRELAGVSRILESSPGNYTIDRFYLANDSSRTDGGQMILAWTGLGIEAALFPVHHTPFFQSPVCLGPGDLLQLCGRWFDSETRVLYQQIPDTVIPPVSPPGEAMQETTAGHGQMPVVSRHGLPFSVAVQAPAVFAAGRTYALWAGDPERGWSQTMLVNDARPLWLTPAKAYAGETIRVVGRNLAPAPGQSASRIRLTGPVTVELDAAGEAGPAGEINDYAAAAALPGDLPPGEYAVEFCRDGTSRVPLAGQQLVLLPLPPVPARFDVTAFGAIPDDGFDDTAAIQLAIDAAAGAGGGEVWLPAGVYHASGLDLPAGVDLTGDGMDHSVLSDNSPEQTVPPPVVRLHGGQTVHHLAFDDGLWESRTMDYYSVSAELTGTVTGLTIRDCRFVHAGTSIGGGPRLVQDCRIDNNEFQARYVAIYFFSPLIDSRIRGNRFIPMPLSTNNGWNYPSEITGCLRIDYSANTVDGTVNEGWRNGPFWNMYGVNDRLLVSHNRLSCTGGKISPTSGFGYGEAIANDSNGNTMLYQPGPCITATTSSITLPAGWGEADQHAGAWVCIVDGPGIGQSRPITGHTAGEWNLISVEPAWDVLPGPDSRAIVCRVYRQYFMVGNLVDQRPQVRKNYDGESQFFGSTVDSVMDGNTIYNAKGLMLNLQSFARDYEHMQRGHGVQHFNEIRHNWLGGYRAAPELYLGGITLMYSSTPGDPVPPCGYGIIIAGNSLSGCGFNGVPHNGYLGGIHCGPGWYTPSPDSALAKETLIFGNTVESGAVGISLEPHAWNTVIGPNIFTNIGWPLKDKGIQTVMLEDLLAPRTAYIDSRLSQDFLYQFGTAANPFSTIQLAVNLSAPGDTFRLAAGVYSPTTGEPFQRIRGDQHLEGTGAGRTIFEGGLSIETGEGGSCRGLTIRGSGASGVAGISIYNTNNYTIADNDISGHLLNGISLLQAQGISIERNTIQGNIPAGINMDHSDARLVNNLITRNWPESGGCGITVTSLSQARLINNTIFEHPNVAVNVQLDSAVSAWNNIVFGGGGGFGAGETARFDFLDANLTGGFVWWNYQGEGAQPGPHGRTANPRFVNPAWNDFRLQAGSPALDAGISAGAPPEDFRGAPRPLGTAWDLGAIEAAPVVMADLDEDGRLTAADLFLLMGCLAGQFTAGKEPFRAAAPVADVSENGAIDSADLILVSQLLVENLIL